MTVNMNMMIPMRAALQTVMLHAFRLSSSERRRPASSSFASVCALCHQNATINRYRVSTNSCGGRRNTSGYLPFNQAVTISSEHPRQNQRHFSSLPSPLKRPTCPFRILNIPKDSKYSHAKKSFLKIAMKHHPDTVGNDCQETRAKSQAIFMKCRTALESLEECPNTGVALLKAEADKRRTMSNEEFDSWFEEKTGHQNPFQFDLDPKVMREVANMHSEMEGSHGLDRDGGMWHLASMISNAVKSGKENGAESILKLEAGAVREGGEIEASGTLSRRRKKKSTSSQRRL